MRSFLLPILFFIYTRSTLWRSVYGWQSPGETAPFSIAIEIGGSANITCSMNLKMFEGKNSSSLYFTVDDTNARILQSNITIINETTIVYTLWNASEQDTYYTCKSDEFGIAMTKVIVGSKPIEIKDFRCQAFDYIYMTCLFSIPRNTIPTNYNLSYVTQNANYIQNCKKLIKDGDRAICNFTLDDGSYKPNFEYYNFILTSNNTLGVREQSFRINHIECVKPAIADFHVVHITTHSCVLTWQMERYIYYKLKRLQMEVQLRSEHHNSLNIYICTKCNTGAKFNLLIDNLPYPYYRYIVSLRVKMRMAAATWSEPYTTELQTMPSVPLVPPAVDASGFYLNATHLRLFWHPTPKYHENGSDFHYIVTHDEQDGVALNKQPMHTRIPAMGFPWKHDHSYQFTIRSSNTMGISLKRSLIIVPALPKEYDDRTPVGISNVYHALNRAYTLSWTEPRDSANLTGYTVFWCQPKSAVSNECNNIIGFIHLSKAMQNFTIQQQSQPLVLAVAANYPDFYTGMHWAKCTADVSNDLEKLEPEIVETKAKSITVRWSSERVCASLIEGYMLTYCRVFNTEPGNVGGMKFATGLHCLEKNITINIDKSSNKYQINGLEPYTTYGMEIYMYSDVKSGPVSNVLMQKTREMASSPPRNLIYNRITSESVSLSWLSPNQENGRIRYYIIVYNNERHVVSCNNTTGFNCLIERNASNNFDSERLFYTLRNLSSFTNYTIYVIAHTVVNSLQSNFIHIRTLVGVPSSPSQAVSTVIDDVIIDWHRPEVPSGRVDYYEVIVKAMYKEQVKSRHISRITNGMSCTIKKPSCDNVDIIYSIGVRAVNVAHDTEIDPNLLHIHNNSQMEDSADLYESVDLACIEALTFSIQRDIKQWRHSMTSNIVEYRSSEETVLNYICGLTAKADDKVWLTIFSVILVSSFMVIIGLVAYKKCHEMSSIKCKLPEGLAAIAASGNGKNGMCGVVNGIITRDVVCEGRSKEYPYNSENGRLLPCISNESEFSNDGSVRSWPASQRRNYMGSDNTTDYCIHNPLTLCNAQLRETGQDVDGYVVMTAQTNYMEMHKDSTNVNSTAQFPNSTQLSVAEKPFTINWPIIQAENGYIKPNTRQTCNWQKLSTNVDNVITNTNKSVYLQSVT